MAAGACAPIASTSPPTSVTPGAFAIIGQDSPTPPAAMQTATTLDVDVYRPSLIMPSCGPRALPTASPDPQLAEAIAKAQAYSDAQKGIGLMVLKDGAIIHQQFADGVDSATQTASASMAKSVLAMVTGIAIDKGMIGSADARTGDYLSEWADDPRGDITIRDLLTMSSGLEKPDFATILFAPDISAAALKAPLASEPGTVFEYHSAVSQALVEIVDRQAKASGYGGYADLLFRELWCPLGNGETQMWVDLTGKPRGYAGLHASLADYARFGELIRNRGMVGDRQIVSPEWIDAMSTTSAANPEYGFQTWISSQSTEPRIYSPGSPLVVPRSEPFEARDAVYLDGFGGQRVYVIPSKGLTIARISFVNMGYEDAIIPNLLTRAAD